MLINKITCALKYIAILLLLGFPVAIIAYRLQIWPMGISFKIIAFTGYISIAGLVISFLLGLFSVLKKKPTIVKGCVIAGILFAIPAVGLTMQFVKVKSLPFIHHVSTDTNNPPQFQAIIALRGENSNPLTYDTEKLAPLQLSAYPEVKPILSKLTKVQAFDRAIATAKSLGWEIITQDGEQGIIEAVDTTLLWAFKDDVVIRIQETETGSKIDLRSISRIGGSDLGANAKRVIKFITSFEKANP